MEISYKRRIFSNEPIERFADDNRGIYIIQKNNEIVFIGESNNLRKDLLFHLSTGNGDKIKLSFYYSNSTNFNPAIKVEELLQKHTGSYGSMPELNEKYLTPNQFLLN